MLFYMVFILKNKHWTVLFFVGFVFDLMHLDYATGPSLCCMLNISLACCHWRHKIAWLAGTILRTKMCNSENGCFVSCTMIGCKTIALNV